MIESMIAWTAIEAWSSPGSQRVGRPSIRAWRTMRSSIAVVRACPRWSDPVAFGGGWMMTNGSASGSAVDPAPSGAKTSAASQRS
jgi:hypothetical protein